jgi:hypothetical protein
LNHNNHSLICFTAWLGDLLSACSEVARLVGRDAMLRFHEHVCVYECQPHLGKGLGIVVLRDGGSEQFTENNSESKTKHDSNSLT